MEPSLAPDIFHWPRPVAVRGKSYTWTLQEGLDPAVIASVEGWIWGCARRLSIVAAKAGLTAEDLVQEGRIGALVAARRFDPDRNANYLTYAKEWIRNHMLDALNTGDVKVSEHARASLRREGRSLPLVVSLDEPVPGASWHTYTLHDLLPASERPESDRAFEGAQAQLREAITQLDSREQDILARFYGFLGDGESLETIGKSWGLSPRSIPRILARAQRRLRLALALKGITKWP